MRALLVASALALATAGCGAEDERETAKLRPCGGSYGNVIMTTEATPDVHCGEALVFADLVAGYTINPSPCFEGGQYGGDVRDPCAANGWTCDVRDDPEHGRGVFDCHDPDRARRLRLLSFYPLAEEPAPWFDGTQALDLDDPGVVYRELHLMCRNSSEEELAEAYDTVPERDAIIDAIGLELRSGTRAEGRRGCKEGFAAYDVLAASGAAPLGIESVR